MDKKLAVGDEAPPFTLLDPNGTPVSLTDYANERVIVYFYPAALTPGCTVEAVDFTDSLAELTDAGYKVIGISPDPTEKLQRFRDKEGITFQLLSDPDKAVISAYGAWGDRTIFGAKIRGVLRSSFVVDVNSAGAGTISYAAYSVRAKGHVAKLKRDLKIS